MRAQIEAKSEGHGRPGFAKALENLSPGYFALVMATGIVSIGLHEVGRELLSKILLVIAAVAYVVLCTLFIWRAIRFRAAVVHDLRRPEIAFAFFTIVAGTDVLAVRLLADGAHRNRDDPGTYCGPALACLRLSCPGRC